jgi:hypothetical protein
METDIKIRLSGEHAESWIEYYLPKILGFDWKNQPLGVYQFKTIASFNKNKNNIAQLSLYRTKTQRVAYISADEPYN